VVRITKYNAATSLSGKVLRKKKLIGDRSAGGEKGGEPTEGQSHGGQESRRVK